MANARSKKKRRVSALTVTVGLFVLAFSMIVSLISTQVEIVSKRQQLANVQAQVESQQAQNTELQRTMEAEDESEYIERMAREKFGYVSPDEQVYVDMSGK